jgi:Bacterial membrane protein YfhO
VERLTCSTNPVSTGNVARPVESATRRRLVALTPFVPVLGSCVVSLVLLRAELQQVPYLNDQAMAEEMVRFALAKIRTGHFPPDSWFPFLNLGSPQFLHYQSLAAMLTALLAWAIGVGRAFTLTTWLLVSCWPLCIYTSARIFGMRRGAAVAAALLSPFIASATGVGFEQVSYLWSGYGVWSQLFAMWTLPFAWAFSWRAVNERRFVVPASLLIAATAAFHFETGYLAFIGVVVFVVVSPRELLARTERGGLVLVGAFASAAWVIVPLIAQGKWAAINQFLQSGSEGVDANSYGARRALSWLADGSLLDWHHLPILTSLLGVGLVVCLVSWRGRGARRDGEPGLRRALVGLFAASLVLFFGRPTLGPLLDLLPGAKDLFLRRFLIGTQLAALYLAGVGAERLLTFCRDRLQRIVERRHRLIGGVGSIAPATAIGCLVLTALVQPWFALAEQAEQNASFITRQSAAAGSAHEVSELLGYAETAGGGRIFAGDPSDWGRSFMVGEVPVFKYLAALDVDEVGFTLRTASLMSDPEAEFDATDPADYKLFGIRWLLLPEDMKPPIPASFVERHGPYTLWSIPGNSYVQVVETRGILSESSGNLGTFATTFLASLPVSDAVYPTVAYGGATAAPGTLLGNTRVSAPPGRVLSERANLTNGTVEAHVSSTRGGVVLLSASYDPGWHATVDGRPVATEMVAPALVGVRIGPGGHTVRFTYAGFPDYAQLLIFGGIALFGLVIIERRRGGTSARTPLG